MNDGDFDPMDVRVNIISVTSHILGFKDMGEQNPPEPAVDPRTADSVMINWIAANATDAPIHWTFELEVFYEWKLMRKTENGYEEIHHEIQEPSEENYQVEMQAEVGRFAIPFTGDIDDPDSPAVPDIPPNLETPPVVPLRDLIAEHEIPDEADLAIWFKVNEASFQHESIFPVWRLAS